MTLILLTIMVNNTDDIIRDKLKRSPQEPGVYQFLNSEGKIIYIGKAINLRSTNERQEGFEFGAVPMTHFDINLISKVLKIKDTKTKYVNDYMCEDFSSIFLNLLLSYTNYINEYNWKKEF